MHRSSFRKRLSPAQTRTANWGCFTRSGRAHHPFRLSWMSPRWPSRFKIWPNSWSLSSLTWGSTRTCCSPCASRRTTTDRVGLSFLLCLSVSAKDWYELSMTVSWAWLKKTLWCFKSKVYFISVETEEIFTVLRLESLLKLQNAVLLQELRARVVFEILLFLRLVSGGLWK